MMMSTGLSNADAAGHKVSIVVITYERGLPVTGMDHSSSCRNYTAASHHTQNSLPPWPFSKYFQLWFQPAAHLTLLAANAVVYQCDRRNEYCRKRRAQHGGGKDDLPRCVKITLFTFKQLTPSTCVSKSGLLEV